MSKLADIGGKRLINLALDNWAQWLTQLPQARVQEKDKWYPVEGHPEIRVAPDAMVVFGQPKGDRGSYCQWEYSGSHF